MRNILLASIALIALTACESATRSVPDQRIGVMPDPAHRNKYVAVPRACPVWDEHVGDGLENHFTPDFGCAQNYNLAKTIVNPADLVRGREPGKADANVGILGIERYRSDKKKELINPKDISGASQ